VVRDGIVVDGAPIFRKLRGQRLAALLTHYRGVPLP
jgi:hypothetical protein